MRTQAPPLAVLVSVLMIVVLAELLPGPTADAHTLTLSDGHWAVYLHLHKYPSNYEVDVARCWRANRHRISCRVYWEHSTEDFTEYCEGIASVRYRTRSSHRKSVRLVSRDCF